MNSANKGAEKILVVDDEKYILRIVKFNLRRYGYEVLTAQNGEEALKVTFDKRPDLILLDIMMPVMDGIEVCKQLKEREDTSQIPIVFLTAREKTKYKEILKTLNIAGYITKPFSTSFLLSTIRQNLVYDVEVSG